MDVGSTGKDISSDVLSQNHCSSKQGVKESSTKAMASKAPEKTGLTANGSGNNQVSSLEQTYLGSEARPEVKFTSHSLVLSFLFSYYFLLALWLKVSD